MEHEGITRRHFLISSISAASVVTLGLPQALAAETSTVISVPSSGESIVELARNLQSKYDGFFVGTEGPINLPQCKNLYQEIFKHADIVTPSDAKHYVRALTDMMSDQKYINGFVSPGDKARIQLFDKLLVKPTTPIRKDPRKWTEFVARKGQKETNTEKQAKQTGRSSVGEARLLQHKYTSYFEDPRSPLQLPQYRRLYAQAASHPRIDNQHTAKSFIKDLVTAFDRHRAERGYVDLSDSHKAQFLDVMLLSL